MTNAQRSSNPLIGTTVRGYRIEARLGLGAGEGRNAGGEVVGFGR